MKNCNFNKFAIMLMTFVSIFLASCSDDDDEQNTVLSVDVTSIRLDGQSGSTGSLRITSNAPWMITGMSNWLSLSSTNGNSSTQITITATSSNNSSTDRECTLLLSSADGSQTQSVTIIQSGLLSSGCEITPTNIVALSDGVAYDFEYGENVVYGYAKLYSSEKIKLMTDAEIISEMTVGDVANRVSPGSGVFVYHSGLPSNSDYVICTMGFDVNNKNGELVKIAVRTKSSTNQPIARITSVFYDDTYWKWTTEVNGFVTKYYQTGFPEELIEEPDVSIAWRFDKALKDDPETFEPMVQNGSWQRLREGATAFHQVTWAVGADGNFSGVIDRFYGTIDNSRSSKVMKAGYLKNIQETKVVEYNPTDLKIIPIRH